MAAWPRRAAGCPGPTCSNSLRTRHSCASASNALKASEKEHSSSCTCTSGEAVCRLVSHGRLPPRHRQTGSGGMRHMPARAVSPPYLLHTVSVPAGILSCACVLHHASDVGEHLQVVKLHCLADQLMNAAHVRVVIHDACNICGAVMCARGCTVACLRGAHTFRAGSASSAPHRTTCGTTHSLHPRRYLHKVPTGFDTRRAGVGTPRQQQEWSW